MRPSEEVTVIDPSKLMPGDRVLLYASYLEPELQERASKTVWRFLGIVDLVFTFISPAGTPLQLHAHDDGTLRDSAGEIVEVNSAS